jgi:histidinol-phosphate phosphatase family protein
MIHTQYALRDFNQPLVLLDRDGTLNKDIRGYTSDQADLELTDFALKLSRLGNIYKFQMAIISNQSGIGRGLHKGEDFFSFTECLIPAIQGNLSTVQMVIACPHIPEVYCNCRKPSSTMLDFATTGSDKTSVCFIGDSDTDKQAASNSSIEFFDVNLKADVNLKLWLEERYDRKFSTT